MVGSRNQLRRGDLRGQVLASSVVDHGCTRVSCKAAMRRSPLSVPSARQQVLSSIVGRDLLCWSVLNLVKGKVLLKFLLSPDPFLAATQSPALLLSCGPRESCLVTRCINNRNAGERRRTKGDAVYPSSLGRRHFPSSFIGSSTCFSLLPALMMPKYNRAAISVQVVFLCFYFRAGNFRN